MPEAATQRHRSRDLAAYQSLILATRAQGAADAVALPTTNLDQETHTSEELMTKLQELSG